MYQRETFQAGKNIDIAARADIVEGVCGLYDNCWRQS
jgi:hypothetical protein